MKTEKGAASPLSRVTSSWGSSKEPSSSGVIPSLPAAASTEMETGEELNGHAGGTASSASEDTRSQGERNSHESTGERPDQCLREYLRLLSADYVCECALCDKGTSENEGLNKVKNIKTFTCDICTYKATKAPCLVNHMRMHDTSEWTLRHNGTSQKKPLKNNSVSQSDKLAEIKMYSCNICPFKSLYSRNLDRHMAVHGEKSYKCDQCDYTAYFSVALKKHKLKHTGVKYACDMCEFKTTYDHYLKQHKQAHSKHKKFSCDQCEYQTNHISGLNSHKLNHTGGKRLCCDICTYRTIYSGYYERHMKAHSLENLYHCDRCEYTTNDKANLKQHNVKHSRDQGSNMPKLQKKYAPDVTKSKLTHLADNTDKRFACDLCKYKTNCAYNFKRHSGTLTHKYLVSKFT